VKKFLSLIIVVGLFLLPVMLKSAFAQPGIKPGMGNVLLWQENYRGVSFMEAMHWSKHYNGGVVTDTRDGNSYTDLSSWVLLGSGDFDGDGYGDFLWLNKSSGDVAVWLMKGTLIKNMPPVLGQVPRLADGSPARVFIADMDQDGKSDIVWAGDRLPEKKTTPLDLNPENRLTPLDLNPQPPRYWYRRWRIDFTSSTPVVTESSGATIGSIQAIGQFDGTGGLDLMATYEGYTGIFPAIHPTGLVHTRFYFANGTSREGPQVSTAWQVRGAGDFDGNGTTDVLWQRSATGEVEVWEMAGGNYVRSHRLSTNYTHPWTIHAVGDLDGNGVSDIVQRRNSDGWMTVWSLGPNFEVLDWGAPGHQADKATMLVGTVSTQQRLGSVRLQPWLFLPNSAQQCPNFDVTVTESGGVSMTYRVVEEDFLLPSPLEGGVGTNGNKYCMYNDHQYIGIAGPYTITTSRGGQTTVTVPADRDFGQQFQFCAASGAIENGTACLPVPNSPTGPVPNPPPAAPKPGEPDVYFFGGTHGALTPVPLARTSSTTFLIWKLCNRGTAPSKPVNMQVEVCFERDYSTGGHDERCWKNPPNDGFSVRPLCSIDPNDLSCFPNPYDIPRTDTRVIPPDQCILQTLEPPLGLWAGYWQVGVDEIANRRDEFPALIRWMCPQTQGPSPCERLNQRPAVLIPPGG
jgi:hypothetical protein